MFSDKLTRDGEWHRVWTVWGYLCETICRPTKHEHDSSILLQATLVNLKSLHEQRYETWVPVTPVNCVYVDLRFQQKWGVLNGMGSWFMTAVWFVPWRHFFSRNFHTSVFLRKSARSCLPELWAPAPKELNFTTNLLYPSPVPFYAFFNIFGVFQRCLIELCLYSNLLKTK